MSILARAILKLFKNRKKSNSNIKDSQKVLIHARGKISKAIMTYPLIREMKKNNPNLQVDILAIRQNAFAFAHNPHINQVYTLRRGLTKNISLWKQLKKQNYDLIIDLSAMKLGTFFFYATLNAKHYFAENFKNKYKLDTRELNFFDSLLDRESANNKYLSKCHLRYLEPLKYKLFDDSLEVYTTQKKLDYAENFFKDYKDKTIIAFNVTASIPDRTIKESDYIYIANKLSEIDGIHVFFITMPNNREKIQSNIHSIKNISLAYETKDIFDAIALIDKIDLLVSPDTSLIHIANGLKKPAIGIYELPHNNKSHTWYDHDSDLIHVSNDGLSSIHDFDKDEVISHVRNFLTQAK